MWTERIFTFEAARSEPTARRYVDVIADLDARQLKAGTQDVQNATFPGNECVSCKGFFTAGHTSMLQCRKKPLRQLPNALAGDGG